MFGFGKKTEKNAAAVKPKKKPRPAAVDFDPNVAAKIHVMPQRFYLAPKKKNSALIMVIIVGFLLIIGVSAVGYFWLNNLKSKPTEPIDPVPAVNQPASNQNINREPAAKVNQNINANVNQATATNQNINLNSNVNLNSNPAVNQNTNSNVNTNVLQPLAQAPDIDGDKLTTAEEILFKTDPNQADTDSDGFDDGEEIINGYDPIHASLTLAESGLVQTYTTPNYSIVYLAAWQVKKIGGDVIFQASSGEFVEVITVENSSGLSLANWYEQQFPGGGALVTAVTLNNLDGLRTPDRRNYYLINPNQLNSIYLLTYNVGNLNQTNFITTFNVMVSNFRLN